MKTVDTELIKKLKSIFISKEKKIVIIPHINPDGDAIGSAVGLGNILFNRGHQVTVIFPNNYPEYYNWIECKTGLLFYNENKKAARRALEGCNILICVDFNSIGRAGKLKKHILGFTGPKILIDHHPDPEYFCDLVFSDISYSSTAEMIFDFISELGFRDHLDESAAASLYSGIMTDTGSFSHNISNPNTFMVISELMKYNLNGDQIHSNVYHNFSADRMKLLGYCLNEKMEILEEYQTAIISITVEELEKYNFAPGDSEGFVNYPLSIKGIIFSALFIEKEDYIKLSFRSKGTFPANRFSASHFHGGGHLNAAGGEDYDSMENTLRKFKQLLPEFIRQLENEKQ